MFYTTKGAPVSLPALVGPIVKEMHTHLGYLEIPLNSSSHIPLSKDARFFIHAGPYLGIGLHGHHSSETILGVVEQDISFGSNNNQIKPLDWGGQCRRRARIRTRILPTRTILTWFNLDNQYRHRFI